MLTNNRSVTQVSVNEKEAELESTFETSQPLKAHRQIPKSGDSKSIVYVTRNEFDFLYIKRCREEKLSTS